MHNANSPTSLRRSSRVPAAIPILVTSLEGTQFSEVCETLVVNAHGCAILTRVKLDSGVPLHLHSKEGRETTARVVSCQPVGADNQNWKLAATFDRPQNFWGLKECPKDWAVPAVIVQPRLSQAAAPAPALTSHKFLTSQPSADVLDRVARQLEAQVTKMIAESVRPLHAELSAMKEKLARRESNPSRFEVSLSSIPPELEEKIELRLRSDFGPKVMEEARQQAARLLTGAKTAIDQKTAEGYQLFVHRVEDELKAVEKRAQDLSAHISNTAREHMSRGLDDFHQKLLEGGNSLKRLSVELLDFLQQSLNDEHNARRGDLEKLRASVQSESSRLHQQLEDLHERMAKLDASAQSLESGLDQRLSQMSTNTVSNTRKQIEAVASAILEELMARGSAALEAQLEEATANMKIVQKGITASVSESLKIEAANALQAYELSMHQMANLSVERWRLKLAGGLKALANSVGEQFQLDESGDKRD
jgi:predicted  nucleic acid-binding Zn-ribbon protein